MRFTHSLILIVSAIFPQIRPDVSCRLQAAEADTPRRPNFILMLSDDQAWNGLSVAMHPDIPGSGNSTYHTPSLEKLASEGMRFSAGYAPAPVCSPTRISLQTGKTPAQLHWTKAAPPVDGQKLSEPRLVKQISTSEVTIGEMLQKAGYATAHYGKWHLSGGGPGVHGYDEHDGDTGNEQAYRFTDPNPVDIFGMADRAAAFMKRCSEQKKPFYIQLSWNALHASENALKATLAKYQQMGVGKQMERAAMTEDLDSGVGRVLDSLDRLGLSDTTYVIYMSDNGSSSGGGGSGGSGKGEGNRKGMGRNKAGNDGRAQDKSQPLRDQRSQSDGRGQKGPLSGGKGDVYENGIRVPWIVRGPGIQPDSWCHVPVVGYDWFPTLCDFAGIRASELPDKIEGGSLKSLLLNAGQGTVARARDELIFHFPHYQGDDGPQSAIRRGDLKVMYFYEDDRTVLFDLADDIAERNDLSATMPAETEALRTALRKHLASVDAQFPTANPDYDPSQPAQSVRGQRGGGGRGGSGNKGQGGGNKMKQKAKRTP